MRSEFHRGRQGHPPLEDSTGVSKKWSEADLTGELAPQRPPRVGRVIQGLVRRMLGLSHKCPNATDIPYS